MVPSTRWTDNDTKRMKEKASTNTMTGFMNEWQTNTSTQNTLHGHLHHRLGIVLLHLLLFSTNGPKHIPSFFHFSHVRPPRFLVKQIIYTGHDMSERKIHCKNAQCYDNGSNHHDRCTTLELRPRRPSYFIHQLVINIWYITFNLHLFYI